MNTPTGSLTTVARRYRSVLAGECLPESEVGVAAALTEPVALAQLLGRGRSPAGRAPLRCRWRWKPRSVLPWLLLLLGSSVVAVARVKLLRRWWGSKARLRRCLWSTVGLLRRRRGREPRRRQLDWWQRRGVAAAWPPRIQLLRILTPPVSRCSLR